LIIQPTSLAALTWAGAAAGTLAPSWRIGSVLSARPTGVSPQGLQILQIGSLSVEADVVHGQLPSQFQVRVLSMGAQPQLEALIPSFEPVLQRALRERLPQQDGYAPLLATLSALAQRPMVRQLSPPLRTALAMLEQAMHTPGEITSGEGLRQAILRSGLFFESQLTVPQSQLDSLPQDDWKGALLRLLELLGQRAGGPPASPTSSDNAAPPLLQRGLQPQPRALLPPLPADDDIDPLLDRLHSEVKAAFARVEVAQLEAGSSPVPAWMIEIPLQGRDGGDVLQLQLEYATDAVDSSQGWNLGFALDLPALGAVQGELQLREPRLSVRLWAAEPATAQRLEQQFTALRQRLAACGVLLDQLSCQVGLPEAQGRHGSVLLQATA